MTEACLRLTPMLVDIARWSRDFDVISFFSRGVCVGDLFNRCECLVKGDVGSKNMHAKCLPFNWLNWIE